MESSTSKAEVMKSLFLKVGIPLSLSVAGFICAKIIARRNIISSPNPSSLESKEFSLQSIDPNDEFNHDKERSLGLRRRVEELERRELDLENHFLEFRAMKEQESMLMEVKNMLVLEVAHFDFLGREISSMKSENERFQNLVVEFLKLLEQLQAKKLENGLLRRKANELSRKMMKKSRIIREKNLMIGAAEEEILRCYNALETRCNVIKKLEDQIDELQSIVNSLQEEKNQLLTKLNAAENSSSSTTKVHTESVTVEEYSKLVKELEQLRKDQATEIAELTYLKWSNACLRHELMRNHEREQEENHLELEEINGNGEIKERKSNDHQSYSRRKKLLHKIKKWVQGNGHAKLSKLEQKEK